MDRFRNTSRSPHLSELEPSRFPLVSGPLGQVPLHIGCSRVCPRETLQEMISES